MISTRVNPALNSLFGTDLPIFNKRVSGVRNLKPALCSLSGTQRWKYEDNPLKPFKIRQIKIAEGIAEIRFFRW
jgi:hypothetical protein